MSKDKTREAICAEVVRLLTEERKRRGMSGNSLAAAAGLSQSLISSLETNPWNPTLDTLLRIADVLEVNIGEVIQRAVATHPTGKNENGGQANGAASQKKPSKRE